MGFRKCSLGVSQANPPSFGYDVEVPVTKKVLQKGSSEPVTVVELKRCSAQDYAKTLGLPHSEDYQLRDMLAAGQMPELVNVSGLLDSSDPTDLQNIGAGDVLFDRLSEMAQSRSVQEPAPVAATVVEPSTPVEPPKTE